MENNILDYSNTQEGNNAVAKAFLSRVFTWMTAALVISACTAWLFANSAQLQQMIFTVSAGHLGYTPLGYIALFAPLAFILVMNFGFEKLSLPVMLGIFIAYALCMGMTLSIIFAVYASALIFKTFLISAGAFGLMAFLGYSTKTDLTKLGSYLYMGLFGIIIASIINYFTGGSTWLIDILGVVVFTGLTSYKVQMLKNMALQVEGGGQTTQKVALFGALSLYITFINLFLTLLRLAGSRR